MIDPSGIPEFTGDFGQLEKDVSALRKDAIGIRDRGMDVHSRFQMLEAFYSAPEADELFATTQPVMDKADGFATKLETVADTLDTYSTEARPLAKRLAQLKEDALAFVAGVEGHDDWTQDADKVHRHQELLDGVTSAQTAFQDAERRAASRISSIVGGPKFVTDDGSHTVNKKTVMYGYGLDTLEHAKELPWGAPEQQTYEAWSWDWFEHGTKSFVWDGLVKDNIEGGLDGLYTLFGGHGSKAAGQAWSGLKDVVTGIGLYTATPYDALMDWAFGPAKQSADETRSKKAAKEFAKGLVAWDKWDENPARASATVVFNVLTLGAGPMAVAAKGSEVGALAKGASVAAKVGEFIDPVSVGLKATGKAISTLPKLSDVTSKIFTGVDASTGAGRVHSVMELDDGSKVVIHDGEFIAYDKQGHVISDTPRQERLASTSGTPDRAAAGEREPALIGSTSHTPEASTHAGGGISSSVGHETPAGHGSGHIVHDTTEGSGRAAASHSSGTDVVRQGADASGNGHVHTGSGGHGNGELDGLGRADGEATGEGTHDATGSHPDDPGSRAESNRPSFMRDGDNPYGPRGSLTPHQIKEIQVYRANHEPGYFEKYYKSNGRRLNTKILDESGFAPVQLDVDTVTGHKTAASDAPPPIPEKYVHGAEVERGRHEVLNNETLHRLDEAAAHRRSSIDYSESADRHRNHFNGSADDAALHDAGNEYKAAMNERTKAAETYGEAVAEHQVIPELYGKATKEILHGPANGNYRFDQVWRRDDGRFVVVEAKSTVETDLGKRDLLDSSGGSGVPGTDGRRSAMQGSREYFMDTLTRMRLRGRHFPSERRLANELKTALEQGKVDYILVKGKVDGAQYAGYEMHKFDIG